MFTAVNVALNLLIGMAIAHLLNRVSRWARLLLTGTLLFVWAVPSTVSVGANRSVAIAQIGSVPE